MTDAKFKVGDIVELRSGGPSMTVTAVGTDNCVDCWWFIGTELQKGRWQKKILVHAPPFLQISDVMAEKVRQESR